VVGLGATGRDQFVTDNSGERQISKKGVQMTDFPTPNAKFHAAEAVLVDGDVFPE
jgi:hypothetical protein